MGWWRNVGCGEAGSLGGGCSQARYPSAVGTEDIPIAMWTEYTGDTSSGSQYTVEDHIMHLMTLVGKVVLLPIQ